MNTPNYTLLPQGNATKVYNEDGLVFTSDLSENPQDNYQAAVHYCLYIEQWPYDGPDSLEGFYRQFCQTGKPIWRETCLATYRDQLECLPPLRWQAGAFLVGEPYTHDQNGAIYAAFVHLENRYFARYAPVKDFNPAQFKTEIRTQFGL